VRAANGHNIKYNNDMITEFMKIFSEWSEKIETELNNSTDAERKQQDQQGPADELENWKDRMRKLTAVNEQLRSQNCQMVYEVLFAVSNSDANKHADSGIYLALSTWRSLILRVTESLNEAKDNVKYLQTLERFIEPLYTGTPVTIKESLPVLLNSIKMIHTVARYYNTEEKMTGLFVKITNQMIINCKNYILTFKKKQNATKEPAVKVSSKKKQVMDDDNILWDPELVPHEELIEVLKQCLQLHETYIAQYEFTKKRLEHMPKTKQFDFSITRIFGRFDLFKRRVSKLIDLFQTIVQFKTLNKHNLEHIEPILKEFDMYVTKFKGQNHRLLDYKEDRFDRDFVEFNVEISDVETMLQKYIEGKFENITNIVDSLRLLRKFEAILTRDTLRSGLRAYFIRLFNSYAGDIDKIKSDYQRDKEKPPIVRNLPPVAGAITWSRHLFYRISVPME
jgi:dynein heavy chain, axonemal